MAIIAAYDISDTGKIVALAYDNDLAEFVGVILAPYLIERRTPNRF